MEANSNSPFVNLGLLGIPKRKLFLELTTIITVDTGKQVTISVSQQKLQTGELECQDPQIMELLK